MAAIESVYAREILDSRGNPTVEVYLETEDGAQGRGLHHPPGDFTLSGHDHSSNIFRTS